uniref:Bm61 n=1 Tax=Brugia malayi TaxID=6279 RepID=A0A1I9FZP5_BRUMA|nr:Bm61 [Brugia malayi]
MCVCVCVCRLRYQYRAMTIGCIPESRHAALLVAIAERCGIINSLMRGWMTAALMASSFS